MVRLARIEERESDEFSESFESLGVAGYGFLCSPVIIIIIIAASVVDDDAVVLRATAFHFLSVGVFAEGRGGKIKKK